MDGITVIHLKKRTLLDISTEVKKQNAAIQITKLILNRVKPLYTIILVNIYDTAQLEQTFKEEIYKCIHDSVKRYVYNNVFKYISENMIIDIEGFILFRLKGLWDIIDAAVQEYLSLKDEYMILTEILNEITAKSENICNTIFNISQSCFRF